METSEYIVYTLLVLILIAFVGIVGYVIYDNYNYKDNLTSDLNTNFKDINRNFKSTSNVINQTYNTHTSNLNSLSDDLRKSSNVFVKDIGDLNYKYNVVASSNIDTSNISFKNIDTFNYNLNKYFTFKETGIKAYSDVNNKLFEYRTDALGDASKLELMTKTFAKSGLQLNTETGKELGICNTGGDRCFNLLNTTDSLYIYKPLGASGTSTGTSNIYIGGNIGAGTSAPFKIVDGEVYINNIKYQPMQSQQQTPIDAYATTTLAPSAIKSILVNNGGSSYAVAPTITFDPTSSATAEAVVANGKITNINVTNGGSYSTPPTIIITPATGGASASAILAPAPIASPTIVNGGTGYNTAPLVRFSGGAGSGAVATASVASGIVNGVTLSGGGNSGGLYTAAPTIYFTRVP